MLERERVQRKQCPQCGWDAAGRPIPGEVPMAASKRTRYDPLPKQQYDCGNCGYQWVE